MKNRTFLFLFLYIYLGFQNFRLIGAEDGNHGWSKIGRIKKGVNWNVLVLFIRIKMSGKEELVERNRNRSHFAAMKRTNRRMKTREKDYLEQFFDSSNINFTNSRSICGTCFVVKQKKKKFSSVLISKIIMGWETMKLSGLL